MIVLLSCPACSTPVRSPPLWAPYGPGPRPGGGNGDGDDGDGGTIPASPTPQPTCDGIQYPARATPHSDNWIRLGITSWIHPYPYPYPVGIMPLVADLYRPRAQNMGHGPKGDAGPYLGPGPYGAWAHMGLGPIRAPRPYRSQINQMQIEVCDWSGPRPIPPGIRI